MGAFRNEDNLRDYENYLKERLRYWWRDYLFHTYKVDCSTDVEIVQQILNHTNISKTSARKFFIEDDLTKFFLFHSVILGFDMPTETGCYIKIYDDTL